MTELWSSNIRRYKNYLKDAELSFHLGNSSSKYTSPEEWACSTDFWQYENENLANLWRTYITELSDTDLAPQGKCFCFRYSDFGDDLEYLGVDEVRLSSWGDILANALFPDVSAVNIYVDDLNDFKVSNRRGTEVRVYRKLKSEYTDCFISLLDEASALSIVQKDRDLLKQISVAIGDGARKMWDKYKFPLLNS